MLEPQPHYIQNVTFDEIEVGASARLVRTLRPEDIHLFAAMSGDVNPTHVDVEYARSSQFREVVAHGMWGGALISTVLGTEYPGPGTVYIGQTLRFHRPVTIGDTITVTITVSQKFAHNHHVLFDCMAINQDNMKVIIRHGRSAGADREDQASAHYAAGSDDLGQATALSTPAVGRQRPVADSHCRCAPMRRRVAAGRAWRRAIWGW